MRPPRRGQSVLTASRPRNQNAFKGFQRIWRPFFVGAIQDPSSDAPCASRTSSLRLRREKAIACVTAHRHSRDALVVMLDGRPQLLDRLGGLAAEQDGQI